MDLFQVLLNIYDYQDDQTIYVIEPWLLESTAIVLKEPPEGLIQVKHNNSVFEYFLEVFVVKEILKNLEQQNLCLRDQCLHIIEYAIYDA
ncbi:hypothetical protein [Acinetobacter modestus]|uniref:hypothetical protein n=1 Tax=Acinetobacter modestus TaxID=1776740 RepID=UPI003019150A